MENKPYISVIMPVYNEGKYIKLAIQSILNQTYKNFELIILNDGSTDGTEKIVLSFKDSRIEYFKSKNKGIVFQLNKGIRLAKGDIIARMDGDDISNTKRLELQLDFLMNNPSIKLVGSNYYRIGENDKILSFKKLPQSSEKIATMMPVFSSVAHPSIMVFTTELLKVKLYNANYIVSQDHALFLEMLKNGTKMFNIQEGLLYYRIHQNSTTFTKSEIQNEKSYKLGKDYLFYMIDKSTTKEEIGAFYFSLGVLEYYRGKMKFARKYFLNSWSLGKSTIIKSMRYYPLSLLGDKIFSFLRKKNILYKINLLFAKIGFNLQLFLFKK